MVHIGDTIVKFSANNEGTYIGKLDKKFFWIYFWREQKEDYWRIKMFSNSEGKQEGF